MIIAFGDVAKIVAGKKDEFYRGNEDRRKMVTHFSQESSGRTLRQSTEADGWIYIILCQA